MADGFIVRRGGKAEEVLRTATPDINFVSKTSSEIVVTFKNNDAGEAEIYYGLTAPLTDTVTLATNTTSSNITFSGLASDTQFTVSAYALVTDPTTKKIKSEIVSTNITTDLEPEYGVQWTQSTDTVVRLDDAVGLSQSDFNTIEPWASMRRCMVNNDKTINYYIDPADPDDIGEVVNTGSYTTGDPADYTGGDGQVMVEIPKFYYKTAEPSSGVYQWYISMGDLSGYSVHPAFVTDGVTRDKIYISAFEGNLTSDNITTADYRSISGVKPSTAQDTSGGNTANGTIAQFRAAAQRRGTGWQIQTYRATQAIQALYLVEYADFDTQTTIGRGYVDAASGSGNESINTGATISLGNASGSASGGTDGLRAISYRGIENFWGNINKWVDGLNIEGNYKAYIANESFASDTFTSPYVLEGTLSSTNGFVTNILFPEFLATAVGGSSTSHLHDDYIQNTGNRVALCGGSWARGSSAGGFFWRLFFASSASARSFGSRLQIL
jgi:hypothetical protein